MPGCNTHRYLHYAISLSRLLLTTLDDRWRTLLVLDATTARTASLDALDGSDAASITIRNLTEDDVAVVEPRSDDGGDEELRAVGVRAGVGHAEHEWLVVGELEVLICELLAVDGFAARALVVSVSSRPRDDLIVWWCTYITTSEVSTLKHELWNHTMELAAGVAEALLAGAESTEVLSGLWNDIVEELEVDAA